MKLVDHIIEQTSDANGDSVDTTEESVYGFLHSVTIVDGDLADNFDITLTYVDSHGSAAITLLTLTNKTADGVFYPREQVHSNAGAGITYDGSNKVSEPPLIYGIVTSTLADGGATNTGKVILHVLESE
jgi:hypothetical protein